MLKKVRYYKCRMHLPRDIERECHIAEPVDLSPDDIESKQHCTFWQYPESELYNVLKICCHPDPSDYHIARFRDLIRYINPGLFQEGIIKEAIRERIFYFCQDRKEILNSYYKKNCLKRNSISPFDFTEIDKPKYAFFGPKSYLIDKIDRWLRKSEISISFILRVAVITIFLAELVILNLLGAAPLHMQLTIICSFILSFLMLEMPIRYFVRKSVLRRARQEPLIFPIYTERLNNLLRELNDLESMHMDYVLKTPELKSIATTISRSRKHPDKTAYSVNIDTKIAFKTSAETLSVKMEIIGQSVHGPHIVFVWFESPKSMTLAKVSIQIINFLKDEISRWLCCRLDFNTKFKTVSPPNNIDGEITLLQYWPLLFEGYHIKTDRAVNEFRQKYYLKRNILQDRAM